MCTSKSSLSENGFDIDRHDKKPNPPAQNDAKTWWRIDGQLGSSFIMLNSRPCTWLFLGKPFSKNPPNLQGETSNSSTAQKRKRDLWVNRAGHRCGCTTDVPTNVCSTVDFWRKMMRKNHWLRENHGAFKMSPKFSDRLEKTMCLIILRSF